MTSINEVSDLLKKTIKYVIFNSPEWKKIENIEDSELRNDAHEVIENHQQQIDELEKKVRHNEVLIDKRLIQIRKIENEIIDLDHWEGQEEINGELREQLDIDRERSNRNSVKNTFAIDDLEAVLKDHNEGMNELLDYLKGNDYISGSYADVLVHKFFNNDKLSVGEKDVSVITADEPKRDCINCKWDGRKIEEEPCKSCLESSTNWIWHPKWEKRAEPDDDKHDWMNLTDVYWCSLCGKLATHVGFKSKCKPPTDPDELIVEFQKYWNNIGKFLPNDYIAAWDYWDEIDNLLKEKLDEIS